MLVENTQEADARYRQEAAIANAAPAPAGAAAKITKTRVSAVVVQLQKADAAINNAALLIESMTAGKTGPIVELLDQTELLSDALSKVTHAKTEAAQALAQLENL